MLLFWFTIGFLALIVLLAVLLIVQQHRTRDYGAPTDHRDVPTADVEAARARASAAALTRRGQASGPF